jgi:Phage P22-like portal protein
MIPKKDPEICSEIRDRIDKWEKNWTINRSLYYEWIDFVLGDQWREDESKLFERYNKIPLIANKLGVLANHLMGDQIQNTPNLQISPDDNTPVQTADIRAALIRNISFNSDSKHIYNKAYWQAIIGGYGAYRIGHDYLNDYSIDQEIKMYGFDDPNICYWDISSKHVCKIDGMYAGFKVRVSRKKFKDKHGKDIESQIATTSITEDSTMAFADDDSITEIHDFSREPEKLKIYKLSDKSMIEEKELKLLQKIKINGQIIRMKDNQPVTVIDQRESVHYKVIHRKIAGDFILEEEEFPSSLLPIIFVDQKSYHTKQGQQITRSFFKDVKDLQKYLNYLFTQSAYIMKVSRYDQFMAPRKCVASPDIQQIWRDPSVVRGALPYDETPSGDKPQRLDPPELSHSLIEQYQQTLTDIQSSTGIYNTQLGDMGNETSGRAIDKRNVRGSKNTEITRDSIDIAICAGGEVINEMIPKIYDTERLLVLSMPESDAKQVSINKPMDEYGINIENDMTKGRYKIRLKAGHSYEGEKQVALESLQSVITADRTGQVFSMVADLYAENLPLDNNLELKNRLRTLVPQEVVKAGKTGEPLPPKPKEPSPDMLMVQLKQQELQQKAQESQMNAQIKMKDIEMKQAELQRKAIETHQDIGMQYEKLEGDKQKAAAELQESILRYQAENQRIGADLQINHSQNLIKLLTHHPKHLDEKKGKDNDRS